MKELTQKLTQGLPTETTRTHMRFCLLELSQMIEICSWFCISLVTYHTRASSKSILYRFMLNETRALLTDATDELELTKRNLEELGGTIPGLGATRFCSALTIGDERPLLMSETSNGYRFYSPRTIVSICHSC